MKPGQLHWTLLALLAFVTAATAAQFDHFPYPYPTGVDRVSVSVRASVRESSGDSEQVEGDNVVGEGSNMVPIMVMMPGAGAFPGFGPPSMVTMPPGHVPHGAQPPPARREREYE